MKAFRIKQWNKLFENSRSRTVADLAWVAIPNHHDGENYSIIMAEKNAAEIFSAWVLMVQVASRCHPRGTLLRDNGKPHDAKSLAIKTRGREDWFSSAMSFILNNTDWIELVDVSVESHQPDTQPSLDHHSSAEEGREGREGIEGNEKKGSEPHFPEAHAPSFEEFWAYCQSVHCGLPAEWYAKDKWLAASTENWKGKENWKAYARRCKGWWQQDGSHMEPKKRSLSFAQQKAEQDKLDRKKFEIQRAKAL